MRITTPLRVGTAAAALALLAGGCSSTSEEPAATDKTSVSSSSSAVSYASAERTGGAIAQRVRSYNSIKELQDDSQLVVVATGTGKVTRDEAEGPADPLAVTTVIVDEVLSGEGYEAGDEIPVFVEGGRDEEGQLVQDKIRAKKAYVLYLTPFRKTTEGQVFAVTGYLAGMYEAVAPDQYGRVDPESPKLPRGLDLSGSGLRQVN